MPDDQPDPGTILSHTDPIIVGGGSILIKVPDGFVSVPVPAPRGKKAAKDSGTTALLLKHRNKKAQIVKIEITSLNSGEVVTYAPRDGKVELKVYFES